MDYVFQDFDGNLISFDSLGSVGLKKFMLNASFKKSRLEM